MRNRMTIWFRSTLPGGGVGGEGSSDATRFCKARSFGKVSFFLRLPFVAALRSCAVPALVLAGRRRLRRRFHAAQPKRHPFPVLDEYGALIVHLHQPVSVDFLADAHDGAVDVDGRL